MSVFLFVLFFYVIFASSWFYFGVPPFAICTPTNSSATWTNPVILLLRTHTTKINFKFFFQTSMAAILPTIPSD
jgi:hypothetical protein